jgi:hypothetical protein
MAVNKSLSSLRATDIAHWGAYAIEDLGILDVDRVIGNTEAFGNRIRSSMMIDNQLNYKWSQIAIRLLLSSPGTINPTSMIAVLCQLCATELFIEDNIRGS